MDFSIALSTRDGKLLWSGRVWGFPISAPQGKSVVTLTVVSPAYQYLTRSVHPTGRRSGAYAAKDELASTVSDQSDLLMDCDSGVLFIDRQHHRLQQMLPQEIMRWRFHQGRRLLGCGQQECSIQSSISTSARTAHVATETPLGVTELSLARQGEFLLSYATPFTANTGLFNRTGEDGMDIPSRYTGD